MNFKLLAVILISFFLIGCKSEEDTDTDSESPSTKTYVPLVIDLSSDNLVMIDNDQMASKEKTTFDYMYAAINFVLPELIASDPACLTIADVGSGVAESVINDPTRCLKKVEKVDSNGGYIIWEEDSTLDAQQSGPYYLVSNTVQKCGIINPDGSVWEVKKCPKKNGGFKNNKALKRVSTTKLRSLSTNGEYIEYDQSNDTETVIINDASGSIDMMIEVDHQNVKKYLYREGNTAKQSINGVVSNVPDLDGKYPHKVGTDLQFRDGNKFGRAFFDGSGDVIQGPNSGIIYRGSAVPVSLDYWYANGVAPDGTGPKPYGPVINDSLNNCDSNKIGDTTVLLCPNGVYKYVDSSSDLKSVSQNILGINSDEPYILCKTNSYLYTFSVGINISNSEYYVLRLTKSNIINETYERVFDIVDVTNDVTQAQIDEFKINSISCSADSVTATTNTKTIIINNADSTPDISYLDIEADGTI